MKLGFFGLITAALSLASVASAMEQTCFWTEHRSANVLHAIYGIVFEDQLDGSIYKYDAKWEESTTGNSNSEIISKERYDLVECLVEQNSFRLNCASKNSYKLYNISKVNDFSLNELSESYLMLKVDNFSEESSTTHYQRVECLGTSIFEEVIAYAKARSSGR